jgi:hypothetical protein
VAVEAGGADEVDMRLRERLQKPAGLLPKNNTGARTAKSAEPRVDAVHAVIVLMNAMVGGVQARAVESVKNLWNVPFHSLSDVAKGAKYPRPLPTFGGRLLELMDAAAMPKRRRDFITKGTKAFAHINVAQKLPYAVIRHEDGHAEHYMPAGAPPQTRFRAPISTFAAAGPEIFLELGDIVMQSRAEAKRLGISISSDDAFEILGHIEPRPEWAEIG